MTASNPHISGQNIAHKPGRRFHIIVIVLSLVSVVVFRVIHDRQLARDNMLYADMHEASEQMAAILNSTPANARLATTFKYMNNPSPGMRYAAVDSLELAHGSGIEEALERAYMDSSTEVRTRVLDLMPNFNRQRAYQLQLAALGDEDCWVKDHAIFLLSTDLHTRKPYVNQSAVPILIRTMTDSDHNLAPLAATVLMKLVGFTGKEWRYSILDSPAVQAKVKERWLNWWAKHSASWPDKEDEAITPVIPTRSDPAPDFLVKDIDGHRISLDDLRGKVVLLNFWGTWCPPCQSEMPALAELDDNYRAKGLVTLGIAVKEKSADSLKYWCGSHGVKYQQVLDADYIAHVYGNCYEVPVTVLIDKRGMIRRRWDGERDYDTFRLAVERLLKE
jgi:peroxiredoxin